MNKFVKATRQKMALKLGITGPAGSVKTYSANLLAAGLCAGGKIALLDTENRSASLYADLFKFDVLDIAPPFTESKFVEGIAAAAQENYSVLIIDSFSHSWEGVLEYKASLDARRGSNSYTNWNQAGAKFKEVLAAILQSPIHVIACMRSKMDYVLEPDIRGKMVPRRIGMAPVMREGIEYEFAVVFDGDVEHYVTAVKDRTGLFVDQRFQITKETGSKLLEWINSAAVPATPLAATQTAPITTPPPEVYPAPTPEVSPQERLQEALFGLPADWIEDFLIDRRQINIGQKLSDIPTQYAVTALERITEFRAAITEFGRSADNVTV